MINIPSKSDLSPEENLILAVYIRARKDPTGKSPLLQKDAALFFIRDGFDPQAIRSAWGVGKIDVSSEFRR